MEEPHRTHKEPAWGWLGALIADRGVTAPMSLKAKLVTSATRRRADCPTTVTGVAPRTRRTA